MIEIFETLSCLSKQGCNMIQIFESLDLVLLNMHVALNMLFQSWEAWHILPTNELILTITKFVSSKFVAGMKGQLNNKRYCP
jgi:hypothetical protein